MVSREGMESITERLSGVENLYFPQSNAISNHPSHRKAALLDLLSRDVALFLGLFLSLKFSVWFLGNCFTIRCTNDLP